LNGGPGCSSLTGLFAELGPCRVNPHGRGTTLNKYSWNNNASVIFLDQPLQVGFSYSEDERFPMDSDGAAEDVYTFLQLFFANNPQFAKNEFHIAGESYAGHYLPAIAKVVSEKNEAHRKEPSFMPINLSSVLIGNGLTDPLVQYEYYPEMACDKKCNLFHVLRV
jgi:cathepsin A (carboxypeptidase C)